MIKSIVLSVCVVLGFSTLARAAEEVVSGTPDALIYELYEADFYVFTPEENPELSSKFLAESLKQSLILDAKRSAGEQGAIDFDVLSFSQDERDISKFATKSEIEDETATVKTSFENHGERMVITYACVKEAGQWRIADVTYEDGTSLTKLLNDAGN